MTMTEPNDRSSEEEGRKPRQPQSSSIEPRPASDEALRTSDQMGGAAGHVEDLVLPEAVVPATTAAQRPPGGPKTVRFVGGIPQELSGDVENFLRRDAAPQP